MATVPFSSALIQALRGGIRDTGAASGVELLDNPVVTYGAIAPRGNRNMLNRPVILTLPTAPVTPPRRPVDRPTPDPRAPGTIPPAPRVPTVVIAKPTPSTPDEVVEDDVEVIDDETTPDQPPVDDEKTTPDVVADVLPPSADPPPVSPPPVVTIPVPDRSVIPVVDLPPILTEDREKTPVVTVNEVDVTDTPAPPTDAEEDFDIDKELGIVQQSDVFVAPKTLNPVTPTTTTKTPSVTVNEVALTDTPAPPTDPADDFEIDRELGLVQQSDVFMGPTTQADVGTPTQTEASAPAQTNDRLISNVGNVTVADIEDFSDYADLLNTDITSTLPAAVPAPEAASQLTDQELMELALFDMMAQELLTGRRPVVPRVTPRG